MKIPEQVVIWKFGGKEGVLKSENNYQNNQGYNLFCNANKKYLRWQTGQLSINLAYDDEPQNKYHFHLPDNQERKILTGEPVAMAIGMGEAYLRYGKQRFGIDLKWTSEPEHQWRIFDASGEKGKFISLDSYYALVNVKVDPADFLIFLEKHMPKTIDLAWTNSRSWIQSYLHAAGALNEFRKEIM